MLWTLALIGLLILGIYGRRYVAVSVGVVLFLALACLDYWGHRTKGHARLCSARQAILDIFIDYMSSNPIPKLAYVQASAVMPRGNLRFQSASLMLYALRLSSQELFCTALAFAGLLLITLLFTSEVPLIVFVPITIFSLAIGALPLLIVTKQRPSFGVSDKGIDISVNDFFYERFNRILFAQRGYGYDYLPMVIDFMKTQFIPWKDVKYFKIERRFLHYRLFVVLHGRSMRLLCSRYSVSNLLEIKNVLEMNETFQKASRKKSLREIAAEIGETMPVDVREAHKHSTNNHKEIESSKKCGCFYCLSVFKPTDIKEWITTESEEFAMCPVCGIDSVLGDASSYPITRKFLRKMNMYWFGFSVPLKVAQ